MTIEDTMYLVKKNYLSISRDSINIVILILFIIYATLGFLGGYGNDNDTYRMLQTWQGIFFSGSYQPSRTPGYLAPELIIGGASFIGGHYLTNVLSSILGASTLYLFWCLIRSHLQKDIATPLIAIIGLNPYYIIASSSSMDYVYSLFFLLIGIRSLEKSQIFIASIFFALTISSRISHVLIIAIVYAYLLYGAYRQRSIDTIRQIIFSGVSTLFLGSLLFIPSFIAYGNTFGFLTYNIGDWGFLGHLYRLVYKNMCLLGVLPCVMMAVYATYKLYINQVRVSFTPALVAGFSILIIQQVLFFKIPIEISHLLPALFIGAILYVVIFQPQRIFMYGLLGLVIGHSTLLNIDILDRKYNKEGLEAIDARIGVFLRPSPVLADLSKREESKEKYFLEFKLLE